MKRLISLASVLFLLTLVPEAASPQGASVPAAQKTKRLRCYKCRKVFSVPSSQFKGACPFCGTAFVVPAPAGPIKWPDARQYMGKVMTVEGDVVGTHLSSRSGKFYLNLDPNWKQFGSIAIPPAVQKRYPSPLPDHFMNKRIRVKGKIGTYRGRPEILVKDPSQLQIIP